MKCYQCGNRLSKEDFCTGCGADVGVYKKILAIPYHNESAKEKEKFTIISDNWC